MRFVDTNVLLNAISTDPDEAAKARAARAILESTDLAVSVQVLQEFYVQAARALGCASVLSEDLADGQDYDGVHVEDPFRTAA